MRKIIGVVVAMTLTLSVLFIPTLAGNDNAKASVPEKHIAFSWANTAQTVRSGCGAVPICTDWSKER